MAIAWRYPIVEAATGAAFALAYLLLGPTPDFVVAAVLLAALIAITAHRSRAIRSFPTSSRCPGIVGCGVAVANVSLPPGRVAAGSIP